MNTKRTNSHRSIATTCETAARAFCLIFCSLSTVVATNAGEPRIVTFDAPAAGATPGSYQGTGCFAYPSCSVVINNWGAVTGYYLDAHSVYHGFVRDPGGKITAFDVPGADLTAGSFNGTLPNAINDEGVIAGAYYDSNGAAHGFLRAPWGGFTTFDVPGGSLLTIPVGLNLGGSVVGSVLDQNSVWHAFERKPAGTFVTFNGPGACDTSPSNGCTGTGAVSINDFGVIGGGYSDNHAVLHGLLRSPQGKLTRIDAPGAGAVPGNYQGTNCLDCSAPINQFGVMAGYYIDADNVVHGFIRSREGKIRTFDAPSGAGPQGFGCLVDCSLGLNDWGTITGYYLDANNVYHGFVRSSEGKITTFDAPGANLTSGSYGGTFPVSINDQGVITGYYLDANSINHGFVLFPSERD